jgi:hypothetical protein
MKRFRALGIVAALAVAVMLASASDASARGRKGKGGGGSYQTYTRVVYVTPSYYVSRPPTVYTPYPYSYVYPQPVTPSGMVLVPMHW